MRSSELLTSFLILIITCSFNLSALPVNETIIIGEDEIIIDVAGDSPKNAINLTEGVTFNASLPGPSNMSSYWLSIELGDGYLAGIYDYVLDFDNSVNSFGFDIYDENLDYVTSSSSSSDVQYYGESNGFGTYYIEIIPYSGSGAFDFFVDLYQLKGSSLFNAMPILPDTIVVGEAPGPGTSGTTYYQLGSLSSDFPTEITLQSDPSTDFDIFVYDINENLLVSNETNAYPKTVNTTGPDFRAIEVRPISGSGLYNLTITSLIPIGYNIDNAIPIQLDSNVTGDIPDDNSLDLVYYRVETMNLGSYRITVGGDAEFEIRVYNSDQSSVYVIIELPPFDFEVLNLMGPFYVRISGTGSYSFNITTFNPIGSIDNPYVITEGELVYGTLPGNGTDGSVYYQIELSGNVTAIDLLVSGEYSLGLDANDDVAVTILKQDLTEIGDFTAFPNDPITVTYQTKNEVYYINLNSQADNQDFELRVRDVPIGSSPDNPHLMESDSFVDNINEDDLSDWILHQIAVSNGPVTYTLNCETVGPLRLIAYDQNQNELARSDKTTCSDVEIPEITIETPPQQILLKVDTTTITTETIIYEILTRYSSDTEPTFTWDAEGEERTDVPPENQFIEDCSQAWYLTVNYSWTDQADTTVTFHLEIQVVGESGSTQLLLDSVILQGSGSATLEKDFIPDINYISKSIDFTLIVTYLGTEATEEFQYTNTCEVLIINNSTTTIITTSDTENTASSNDASFQDLASTIILIGSLSIFIITYRRDV